MMSHVVCIESKFSFLKKTFISSHWADVTETPSRKKRSSSHREEDGSTEAYVAQMTVFDKNRFERSHKMLYKVLCACHWRVPLKENPLHLFSALQETAAAGWRV